MGTVGGEESQALVMAKEERVALPVVPNGVVPMKTWRERAGNLPNRKSTSRGRKKDTVVTSASTTLSREESA